MNEITFLTTSRIKLAHARHLCKDYNVKISQHKELYYGKSYDEPRITDREQLLKESINNAISTWRKYFSNADEKPFFIEDTSVRINALSSGSIEIPGVDIKFWMKENDFNQIDKLLKSKGNDRSATVYSHLVLFLPRTLQIQLNKEYVVFSSSMNGFITNFEYQIETNPLYPWLDNKTFNKWFIPDGYNVPISLLNIEDADNVDFRKGAFESMLTFLNENKLLFKKVEQPISYTLEFEPYFIICGPTCSGKTTIAQYLLKRYNYYHIEASDFMYLNYYETHGTSSQVSIGEFAKSALETNPAIVVDRLINHLRILGNVPTVITGFRSPAEIEIFNSKSSKVLSQKLIYLDADFNLRFQRWSERKRDVDFESMASFQNQNKIQEEMGLLKIKELPKFEIFLNERTLPEFFENFQKHYLSQPPKEKENFDFTAFSILKLEDLIILSIYKEIQECVSYFTTTEISHLIQKHFGNKVKKHKDNISRYFNQRFYPYYEVKNIEGKNKFTLTPTGISKAYFLILKYTN